MQPDESSHIWFLIIQLSCPILRMLYGAMVAAGYCKHAIGHGCEPHYWATTREERGSEQDWKSSTPLDREPTWSMFHSYMKAFFCTSSGSGTETIEGLLDHVQLSSSAELIKVVACWPTGSCGNNSGAAVVLEAWTAQDWDARSTQGRRKCTPIHTAVISFGA